MGLMGECVASSGRMVGGAVLPARDCAALRAACPGLLKLGPVGTAALRANISG